MSARRPRLIAIGASTGGVEALTRVLAEFPADCPPTLVVQHMPGGFTGRFAERLDALCAPKVAEAFDGAPLAPGAIWLAPGGAAHLEVRGRREPVCALVEGPPLNRHQPAVDALFLSVAETVGAGAAAALLTGMGRDGAAGLRRIRLAGGRVYAQSEETCTVYGMPRVACMIGAVDETTPLDGVAAALLAARGARAAETA